VTGSATGFRYTLTDNNAKTIVIDDDAFASFTGVAFVVNTTCFASVTGVMSLNITDDERRLEPRQMSDFVLAGSCN
jgi:hypothetical protein